MKMVIAYIRPEQLQRVKQELFKRELYSSTAALPPRVTS